jgi:hypothetical protein
MGRNKKPDHELLHPRYKRKSFTCGEVNPDAPEPTKATLKRWKPIFDACCKAVLTNETLHAQPIKNKIRINWGPKGAPEGFPGHGRNVGGSREYNAETVLLWMYENKLSPYNPSMLYRSRLSLMHSINKLLDAGQESLYNGLINLEE